MKTFDLHTDFLKLLNKKIPRKTDLIEKVADLLKIERDAAYRRLSGKVNFSLREAGIIAHELNFSIDQLMPKSQDHLWLPFTLEYPMTAHSVDSLYDVIDSHIERVKVIVEGKHAESGNIYNSLPMEFFLSSPILTKFMFFKWGYYFVGTEEFDNFSTWETPQRVYELGQKLKEVYRFEKIYYIWDESLIWNLCKEVANFHKINVLSNEETREIAVSLTSLLNRLEKTLNGNFIPLFPSVANMEFYASSINIGFVSNYFLSEESYSMAFQTNFSFSMTEDRSEDFERLKKWMDSFRNISVLLSKSGRIERKLFFNTQYRIIEHVLKVE